MKSFISFIYDVLWQRELPKDSALTLWGGDSKNSVHLSFDDLEAEVERADIDKWAKRENLYFGLGARVLGLNKKQQGRADQVCWLPGFAIDHDLAKNGTTPEEAEALYENLPNPTGAVWSGGGFHAYWLFKEMLPTASPRDRGQVTRWYREFYERVKREADRVGQALDPGVNTIQRVWRAPGTFNHKPEYKTPRKVTLEFADGPRYHPLDLVDKPKKATKNSEPPIAPAAKINDLLEKVRTRLRQMPKGDSLYREIQCLLNGESFGRKGRHHTLVKLANKIAWFEVARAEDPEHLAELFRPLFLAWQKEADPNPDRLPLDEEMAAVVKKLRTAQAKWEAKVKEDNEHWHEFWRSRSKRVPDKKELILCKSPSYHVWDFREQQYGFALAKEDLQVFCKNAWGDDTEKPPGVETRAWNEKLGKMVEKTAAQLCLEYGTAISGIVGDLSLQESHYDPDENIFYPALAPLRDLEPLFSQDIDDWLEIFAGKSYEKTCAWLAALPRVDRPNCVLYIEGPPGAGKGAFAEGCGRLYTRGSPASFENAMATHNEEMARCPLLWCDEGTDLKRDVGSRIRALVGGSGFILNAKYRAAVQVRGCPRVLVTANNPNALRFFESNSKRDIEAISLRILHIEVPPAAAEHLKARGGARFVGPWINDDLFARHILWLYRHYKYTPGGRFLVEGEQTDYHRDLRYHSEADSSLLEFCVRFATDPRQIDNLLKQNRDPGLSIGDGQILATAQGILDNWEFYLPGRPKPVNGQSVGKGLHKFSLQRIERRKSVYRYFHVLDFDELSYWADKNGIGNSNAMKKNLEREL